MSETSVSPIPMSRRRFLKVGCITAAGAGVTLCGGAGLVSALRPDPAPFLRPSLFYGDLSGPKVLIVYASATGSTIDIVALIGETLGQRGFSVDIRPVERSLPAAGYQAAILGSAIHGGDWLPEAIEYVRMLNSTKTRSSCKVNTPCVVKPLTAKSRCR